MNFTDMTVTDIKTISAKNYTPNASVIEKQDKKELS